MKLCFMVLGENLSHHRVWMGGMVGRKEVVGWKP